MFGLIHKNKNNFAIEKARELYSKVNHLFPYDYTDLDIVLQHIGLNAYLYNPNDFNPDDFKDYGDLYRIIINASGYLVKDEKKIYVNILEHPVRQRFTIAHEIGHYYLNHENTGFLMRDERLNIGSKKEDQEANAFAMELLMPENKFIKLFYIHQSYEKLARIFGVSYSMAKNRYLDLLR